MRNVIRRLKHERRKQNRLISTYSGMLRRHNPELAARVYIEEETGDLQLLNQAEVDEGALGSADHFQTELKDGPVVKSLFCLKNTSSSCILLSPKISMAKNQKFKWTQNRPILV